MNLTNLVRLKAGVSAGLVFTLTVAALCCAKPAAANAQDTEALALKLPAPTLKGTPEDLPVGPNIEPLSDKPRPPFMAPKGVKNVAKDKTVTSSVKPFTGEVSQLTDGKKEAFDYDSVEMKKGSQWIQVDLGEPCAVYAVVMWHDHRYIQVMHDVIVQVSDDPEFQKGVTTIFNNDVDNSSGLGVGTDREYFETHFGKIVDGKGAKGRYVRCYTKGGSLSALNCWQEVEIYALPAGKSAAMFMPPATVSFPGSPTLSAAVETPAPAVAPTEIPSPVAEAVAPVNARLQTRQTESAPVPTPIVASEAPTFVNETSIAINTVNNTQLAAASDWRWPFVLGSVLVLVALGAYVIIRNFQISALSKAK